MLKGRKILIGITGSIAAYKIPLLIRLLRKEQAEVRIVLTPAAGDFVTPLTLAVLSGNPVRSEAFDPDTGEWHSHVELGLWADVVLLAPVSANTMAKMAMGVADNFLLTVYLSARCPVFFAPAMDREMFRHPATRKNIRKLTSYGNMLIPPSEGDLASGLCGEGRMEEPEKMHEILHAFFRKKDDFKGKKILVTAGPTHEAIDPVRFLGNHSSGAMGYALAEEFAERGGEVLLISGPANLELHSGNIQRIGVTSAAEMKDHCMAHFPDTDICVMAAAIADYTPDAPQSSKIKKDTDRLVLSLKPTDDILAEMGRIRRKDQFLAGFALETDNGLRNAHRKLERKNLDMIVLNSLNDTGAGFQHQTNKITILDKDRRLEYELKPKKEVAMDIADYIKSRI